MKKIIDLQSKEELDAYISDKDIRYIDDGSEGECFLGNDGLAYKIFYDEPLINDFKQIDIEDIITESEYPLESFAFPKVIFTINGELKCYTSKFVNNNIFKVRSKESSIELIKHLKSGAFVIAYNRFVEDLEILSNNGIKLFDLCNNILYDGESLTAIDTIYYTKQKGADIDKIRTYNMNQFRAAISEEFSFALRILDKECDLRFSSEDNIETFIEDVLIRYDGEEALLRKIFG